jgi:hypothetical protein
MTMKKMFIWVVVLCFLPIICNAAVVDQNNLKKIAEENGFGYKYANLWLLNDQVLTEANKRTTNLGIRCVVPDFSGISSDEIKSLLTKNRIDIQAKWTTFIKKYAGQKDTIFANKNFPADFMKDRAELQKKLEDAWNSAISGIITFEGLGFKQEK